MLSIIFLHKLKVYIQTLSWAGLAVLLPIIPNYHELVLNANGFVIINKYLQEWIYCSAANIMQLLHCQLCASTESTDLCTELL